MIEVPLTRGKVALIDDADYELVSRFKWHAQRGGYGNTYYAVTNIRLPDGKWTALRMHVLLLGHKGIDHIDGDGLNNQRSNLRLATQSQNSANTRLLRKTNKT